MSFQPSIQYNAVAWSGTSLTTSRAHLLLRGESRTELARAWDLMPSFSSWRVSLPERGEGVTFARFSEVGSLRLDFGRSRPKPASNNDCILLHRPGYTKED